MRWSRLYALALAAAFIVVACGGRLIPGDPGERTQATTQAISSSAGLELQVLTNACDTTHVLQFLEVANQGTTSVKTSDITVKLWADDTSGQKLASSISGNGGCLYNASGACTHVVTGLKASVAPFSPACGADPTHQANWEVTISNTDPTPIPPGYVWNQIRVQLNLANHSTFSPGTADWYSPCLTGTNYAYDTHFAVYVAGNLVTGSPGVPPSCRAAQGSMPVAGEMPQGLGTTYPLVGPLPASAPIGLAIGLPLVNQAGLDSFIQQVSDPTSPTYRQYVTPTQFGANYGPSQADYTALQNFATANGLTVTGTYSSRALLSVAGTAAAIENAFFVTLNVYQRPDGSTFYAPANDPSLNLTLTNPILDITGLDSFAVPVPAGGNSPTQCSGAGGFYGTDMRTQYLGQCGPPFTSPACNHGEQQTIALAALDTYDPQNISTYANATATNPALGTGIYTSINNIFPSNIEQVVVSTNTTGPVTATPYPFSTGTPPVSLPSSANFNVQTLTGQTEVELGMEMILAMAPEANLVVYEQNTNGGLSFNADNLFAQMAEAVPAGSGAGQVPQVISNSWTWAPATNDKNLKQVFEQYAAQGQSLFQASGDTGAYNVSGSAAPNVPAPIIYSSLMTVVGGTVPQGSPPLPISTEVAWNNSSENAASAGGFCNGYGGTCGQPGAICPLPVPPYQAGITNVDIAAGNTVRLIPDVSMIADNLATVTRNGPPLNPAPGSTNARVAGCSHGTSASAALWAGFTAIANQSAAAGRVNAIGFANPLLYQLASSGFDDVTSGTNALAGTGYHTTANYDLVTGLGSPAGTTASLVAGLPPQSCMAGTSVSALIRGKAVTVYVPAGSYSEAQTGIFAVPVEEVPNATVRTYPTPLATNAPPTAISTGSDAVQGVINTCAGNSQTGKIICTSNGSTVWFIDGTVTPLANQMATSQSDSTYATGTEPFSAASCQTCNVTVDSVGNKAYLSIGTSSGAAILPFDMAANTFGTPITTGQPNTSEDIVFDSRRGYLLAASGGDHDASGLFGGPVGDYQIVAATSRTVFDNVIPTPASPPTYGFDSAAEDCQTGVALASDETQNSLFFIDLNQVTCNGSTGNLNQCSSTTDSLGSGSQFFQIPEMTERMSGISVVSDLHVGVAGGEFGGEMFVAMVLPSSAPPVGTAPTLQDYVVASLPHTPDANSTAWLFGGDPHTMTTYKSPNSGAPYAVFEDDATQDGTRTYLAVVDLAALIGRPRSSPGSHVLATPLAFGTDTCTDIDPTSGVNPAGCIVRYVSVH